MRVPAALCGVVGLKPTYGRVSRYGIYPLAWSLDHPGPLARTVTDAALMLQAIAGYDDQDRAASRRPVPEYTTALTGEVRGLRVGVPRTLFFEHLDPQVEAAVEAALNTLRSLGVTCVDLELPLMRYVPAASFVLLLAEAYAVHEPLLRLHADKYGAMCACGCSWAVC